MKKHLGVLVLASTFLLVSCGEKTESSSSSDSENTSSSSSIDDLIHVNKVLIKNGNSTLKVGDTLKLEVEVSPSNASNPLISYSSSDSSVASVDFNGNVVARKIGSCSIKATSDDDPLIYNEITITVIAGEDVSFDVSFPENVEIVESTNNKFYKLIAGSSYILDISFTPNEKKELEAVFSLDDYASFDPATNTLKAISRIDSLTFTLNIKGTTIKKSFNLKIVSEGENDLDGVLKKLQNSQTLENNKYVNHYDTHYVFDTVDINYENHYVTDQTLSYDVYENGKENYMLAAGKLKATSDSKTIDKDIVSYKGIDTNAYYEYLVDTNGNHLKTPLRKEITDSNKGDSQKKSTLITDNNSHFGLSSIALFQVGGAGAYESSFGRNGDYTIGSVPIYFGGNNVKNDTFKEEGNTISIDTYCVDEYPTSQISGKVFFNHGEYTFNDDGILVSIKVDSKQYDEQSFDFETSTLKENPKVIRSYKVELSQSFGDYKEHVDNDYLPNNLYFTDYTPVLVNSKGEKVSKYSSGEKYYLTFEGASPKIATDYIDSLSITKVSSKDIASIQDDGGSVTFNKSGEVTLTVYSNKNKVKKEITLNVDEVMPTSLTVLANSKTISDSLDLEKGKSVTFSFLLEPSNSTSSVNASITSGNGDLSRNSDGTYTFKATNTGDISILFQVGEIKKTIVIHVSEQTSSDSLVEKMMKKTYKCSEIDEEHSLLIKSSTKAIFKINDGFADYEVSYGIQINETNKTIRFTSFTVSNDEEYDYKGSDLPFIKTNIDYTINDENSFVTKLIVIDSRTDEEDQYSNAEECVFEVE